jgi:hypothetical protein
MPIGIESALVLRGARWEQIHPARAKTNRPAANRATSILPRSTLRRKVIQNISAPPRFKHPSRFTSQKTLYRKVK